MNAEKTFDWLGLCFTMMLDYIPENLGDSIERNKFIEIAEHADLILCYSVDHRIDDFEHKHDTAWLFKSIGYGYKCLASYDLAMCYYQKSISIMNELPHKSFHELAIVYSHMATIYEEKADHDKAYELFNKSIGFMQSVLNAEEMSEYSYEKKHQHLATLYANIGNVCKKLENHHQALVWYEKASAIFEKYFDALPTEAATVYNNIATYFLENDNYDKAEIYCKKALDIREKYLGIHLDTAVTYGVIAGLYLRRKQYEEAEKWFERDYNIRRDIVGDEHPDTGICFNNIAGVSFYKGNYDKCILFSQKAIEIFLPIIGQHPWVSNSYFGMAQSYLCKSDFVNAQNYFEKSLLIRETSLGINHPDTAACYSGLGYLFFKKHDYIESLFWYKKSFNIRCKNLGINHPKTKTTISNIVHQYELLKENKKGQEFIETVLNLGYEK